MSEKQKKKKTESGSEYRENDAENVVVSGKMHLWKRKIPSLDTFFSKRKTTFN